MNQKEIELVQQSQKGSLNAFEQLYNLYCQEVYQQICLTIRNLKEAKNILQATFIMAGQNLNKLNEPKAFRVWLHWIARRQCRQFITKNGYSFEGEDENLPYISISMQNSELYVPTVYAEDEEKRKKLGKIIAALNDTQREVVSLYYMGQLDADETSGVLESTLKETKTLLYMARCEIRDAIQASEAEDGEALYGVEGVPTASLQEVLPTVGESMSLPESTAMIILNNVVNFLRGDDAYTGEEDDPEEDQTGRKISRKERKASKEKKEKRVREPREKKERTPMDPVKKKRLIFAGLGAAALILIVGLVIFFVKGCGSDPSSNPGSNSGSSSAVSGSNSEVYDPGKLTESDAQKYYTSTLSKLDNDLAYDGVIKYAADLLGGDSIPDYYQIRCLQEAYYQVTGEKLSLVRTISADGDPAGISDSEKKAVEKKASLVDEDRGYAYCSLQDLQKILDYFYGAGTIQTQNWIKKTDSSNNQFPYATSNGWLFYANAIDVEADGAVYYSLYGVAVDTDTPHITVKALRRDNYLTLKDVASGHSYYNADPEAAASESQLYGYYLRNGNEGNIYTSLIKKYEIDDYFLGSIEISLKKENGSIYITGVEFPERGDYVVNTDWLRVRSEPSTDGDILGFANEGEFLTILTRETGANDTLWGKVRFQGQEGYVSMDYVEKWTTALQQAEDKNRWDLLQASITRRQLVRKSGDRFENETSGSSGESSSAASSKPEEQTSFPETLEVLEGGTYQVDTPEGMNVRSGPSADYERVGGLNAEDIVEVYEILSTENGDWGKVVTEEGVTGYVYMVYMKKV